MRWPIIKNLSWVILIALAVDAAWIVTSWMVPFYSLPWWFCWFTGFLIGMGCVGLADIILDLIHHIRIKLLMRKIRKEFERLKK